MKKEIQSVIRDLMEATMDAVAKNPFVPSEHQVAKPLYAALVPDEIFKGSHFERRFTTRFGTVWEKLAVVAARNALGDAEQGVAITGTIRRERSVRITEVLSELEHNHSRKPNWDEELRYILSGEGSEIPVSVTCDLVATNVTTGEKMAFELKSSSSE